MRIEKKTKKTPLHTENTHTQHTIHITINKTLRTLSEFVMNMLWSMHGVPERAQSCGTLYW